MRSSFTFISKPLVATPVLIEPKLGEGIYLVRDVADILCLPYSRVRNWMAEFWDVRFGYKAGHKYSFGAKKNKAVNAPHYYTDILPK